MRARCGVVLFAKDLARLADFYARVLELRDVERGDGYVVLHGDGIEVVVLQIPPAIAADIEITSPPEVRESTPIKPAFLVTDLATLRARITAAGGRLAPAERVFRFRGELVLDGVDPEGNVVQFRAIEAAS